MKKSKLDAAYRRYERAVAFARGLYANPATPPGIRNVAHEFLALVDKHPACKFCKMVDPVPATCNGKCLAAATVK